MSSSLLSFIIHYGYLSVFLLVFIQELGIPTFPNEISLLYFGYIAFEGILKLDVVILLAILGDFSGTCLVYFLFYFFSKSLKKKKSSFLPVPRKALNYVREKINRRKKKNIFLGRLTPYLRGYTSVVCGVLKIDARTYVPIVFLTAVIWSAFYLLSGYFLGPYWNKISPQLGVFNRALLLIPLIICLYFLIKLFIKKTLFKNDL